MISDNHSRVILSGDEKTDYINASFIDVSATMHTLNKITYNSVTQYLRFFKTVLQGLTEKYYIATQGKRFI